MLTFILISFLYIIAEVACLKWFYLLIQEGAPIDLAFRYALGKSYQDILKDLYASDKVWKNNLGKAIGDCEMCLSFWFPIACFICYAVFCRLVLHYWVTDEVGSNWAAVFVNIVWYLALHSVSALIGWGMLLKTKKNGL